MQKSYYAVIPATVRYSKDIPDGAKLLYGEITALANETGYCWASNRYFSELYGKSIDTIGRWISILARAGFILTLVEKEDGNSRKIWLTESQRATGKNADTLPAKMPRGSRQKCGEATGKNVLAYKENNTVNITLNTTTEESAKSAVEADFSPLEAETLKNPSPSVAPAPLPAPPVGEYRTLNIKEEVERLVSDPFVLENFRRRTQLPETVFSSYVGDFALHVQTLQKTYSNVPEFRSHFFNYCDTHKKKAQNGQGANRSDGLLKGMQVL